MYVCIKHQICLLYFTLTWRESWVIPSQRRLLDLVLNSWKAPQIPSLFAEQLTDISLYRGGYSVIPRQHTSCAYLCVGAQVVCVRPM